MAEANFDEFVVGGRNSRVATGGTVNVIGAITTLALVVGVGIWGYRLAVRDASGVPVIQAMEGPMRTAPDNPGGRVAAHGGLSINRIAAEGTAAPVPDQIVLAEPPLDLEPEDSAGVGTAAPAPVVEEDTMARTLALAEELARQVAAEVAASMGNPMPEPETTVAENSAPLPAGAIQRSIRPMPRPARISGGVTLAAAPAEAATLTQVSPVSAPAATLEIALGDVAPGTRLAQIGAFDDADTARQEWERVAARHPALFEGKNRVIQTATSVGRTFYRLRVSSFASEDDTRRFCSAITAPDLRCISVVMR